LAALAASGVTYSAARTTTPSDSFPGLLSMVTGGTPKTTGVYYDDSYDRTLYAPGSNCATGATTGPGIEAVFDESIEHDFTQLFSPIDPNNLPMAKSAGGACTPVYPHNFIQVNTIFEVVKAAGGLTAWSDKHPAYDLVNGPSGAGVDDLYTPEVNSPIANGGTANGVNLAATLALCDGTTNSLPKSQVTDYTTCVPAIDAYDDTKIQAVLNQIDGKKSDGSAGSGVPKVFGTNLQQVSVTQKLPVGGYTDAKGTPSTQLAAVLAHTDASLGKLVAELKAQNLLDSTLIIVTAKHGQSPIDKTTLAMKAGGNGNATVQDPSGSIAAAGAVTDAPSSFTNPNSGNVYSTNGHLQTDDTGLIWLQGADQSKAAAVAAQLTTDAAKIFANTLPPGTIWTSNINSGSALAAVYGDPTSSDPVAAARAPNIVIQPNAGVIYSGSSKKIAEHGGGTVDDTNVALIVSQTGLKATTMSGAVSTTQIAPSILKALGLDPTQLQAVQKEGTTVLPGLF
ncbi:MAG TPA: alkaline phosphatase family protein, partial [Nevskia sp.]|nr:alkaline phosphatase family protein [Nevskia sp.]